MKYIIINIVEDDVTAVHTKNNLYSARKLALKMVYEQLSEISNIKSKEILDELESNGYYKGNGWSVWIWQN